MNKRLLKNIAFDFTVVYPAIAAYFFVGISSCKYG